jgi:putative flippase GtrA
MKTLIEFFLKLPLFKRLAEKFPILEKIMNYEVISYLVFGVLTTVVSIVSYCVSVRLISAGSVEPSKLQVSAATVISWILAVSFAYITNKLWVFNSKTSGVVALFREVCAFVAARLFSLGFELVWMNVLVFIFGAKYDDIYKLAAQFAIVVMNYVFSKLFIFKKEK